MRACRWTVVLTVVLLAVAPGCNCGGGGGNDGGDDGGNDAGDDGGVVVVPTCPSGLQSITVTPADSTVHVAAGSSATTVQLSATGTVAGGGTQDLTSALAWTVSRNDDSAPGSITQGGLFTSAPGVGGVTTVTASCQGISGATTVSVVLDGATFTSGDGGTPSDFGGTVVDRDATHSPVIVYPSNETRFPRNIYKVLFQWVKKGNSQFRVTFAGPFSTTQVYTDGKDPQCAAATTAGCWESGQAEWNAIASSNAGHPVAVTVDGVAAGDPNVYRSAPITIAFSRRDVRGAIFYWSTTAAGIRRANVSDAVPEPYEVAQPIPTRLDDGSLVKCVACHTVSRSGQRMIAYTETSSTKGVFTYDIRNTPPPGVLVTTQIGTARAFGTFAPDDAHVVATVGNLLAEFDAVTGMKIGPNLPVPAGTNPDWSPTGKLLAYSDKGGDSPGTADLSLLTRSADGGWGNPRILVPAAGLTNLFPSFTFDGDYIAYSRGKGGHGDKTLQLWMASADGGMPPVELVTANRVVSSAMTNGQFENNMPTWAPAGDLEWVAFNSLRPYGVVLPGGGTQQIWVAAVDRSHLDPANNPDGGRDPSYPAFRFAFQDLNENNHRAFWTLDVRYDQPDGGSCRPQNSPCDAQTTCCAGLECQAASEISYLCAPPVPDAGTCIGSGGACSQTSGSPCCSGLNCDNPDGGALTCQAPPQCGGIGASCTSSASCCSGMFCLDAQTNPCSGSGCSCQVVIN